MVNCYKTEKFAAFHGRFSKMRAWRNRRDSEDLKSSAEICMRVRIPPPVPASPSRPVPFIEERGDFFSYPVRRLDGFLPAPNHDMRFSPSVFPCRLNCDIRLPSFSCLPASRTVFSYRCLEESYSILRAAPLFGLAGRDVAVFLPTLPSRWAGRCVSRLAPAPLSA